MEKQTGKGRIIKIVIVPPYKGSNWTPEKGQYMIRELVENMRERGQLEGVEIDIDDGTPLPEEMDYQRQTQRANFLDYISVGVAQRVRYYSDLGQYDAIVQTGDLDPGFNTARIISKIPFVSAGHAGIHVASLIGNRFTFFAMKDSACVTVRRFVRDYGFDHKVISVRGTFAASSSPIVYGEFSHMHSSSWRFLARDYPNKKERFKLPESQKIVKYLTDQCIAAIEKDRVDSIILGCPIISVFEEVLRQSLDEAGYSDIPLIVSQYAAVEMAKALVSLKLTQARRAYPTNESKPAPEFR